MTIAISRGVVETLELVSYRSCAGARYSSHGGTTRNRSGPRR